MKLKTFFFIIGVCIILSSCDSARIYEENITIPDTGWELSNKLKYEVDIIDAAVNTNFYVNVRHAEAYPYSNLFLFITTNFPDGKKSIDTLECVLADEKGQWLGDGIGDIFDNQIPFKKNVRFPKAGKYIFEIEHGMRTPRVPLLMDIGLRIEKTE